MTQVGAILGADDLQTVRFFGSGIALAADLANIRGSTFMTVRLSCDMLETDKRGALKRMKKTGNPFLADGKTLQKFTTVQVSVNFDYEAKRERREGAAPETHGNWMQAVIVGNYISPLATHKDDIVTVLETDTSKAILDNNGQIVECLANRRCFLDSVGNVQFTTQTPRLYLRAEIQRNSGDGSRDERTMRSKSVYIDQDGHEVSSETVEPFLKSRTDRTDETDFVVYDISNVVELKVKGLTYRNRITEVILNHWPVPA